MLDLPGLGVRPSRGGLPCGDREHLLAQQVLAFSILSYADSSFHVMMEAPSGTLDMPDGGGGRIGSGLVLRDRSKVGSATVYPRA